MKKQKVKLTTIGKKVSMDVGSVFIKRPVASVSFGMLCICVLLWKMGFLDKGSVMLVWVYLTFSGLVLLFLYLLIRPKDRMFAG